MKTLLLQAPVAALALLPGSAAAPAADLCERDCLEGFVDRYLGAVAEHRPDRAPRAAGVRYTEDAQRLAIGDGLWNTLRAQGPYRLFVTDAPAGQVTFFGSIEEDHADPGRRAPALLALRLRVQDHRITEIEQLVIRDDKAAARVNAMSPDPLYRELVPAAERMSRADLIATANEYFTGMQQNDGRGDYPFTDDCSRIENGMQSARNRVPIADEETGLAFGLSHFHHSMQQKELRTIGVPGEETRRMDFQPFDLPAMHIYKIWGGQIHEIEAIGVLAPYNSPTGWE